MGGGGEDVAHSSVLPCQGSAETVRGFRSVTKTLTKKTVIETAMTNAPTVATRLRKLHPRFGA